MSIRSIRSIRSIPCICAIIALAAAGAEDVASTRRELRSLRETVLANPLDAASRYRLLTLRAQDDARRARALGELADGLAAYCSNAYAEAEAHLKAAGDSPDVIREANAALSVSVSDLLLRARQKQQETVPDVVRAFMQFAGKAAYLAEGGVDFDSAGSLACSPRLAE